MKRNKSDMQLVLVIIETAVLMVSLQAMLGIAVRLISPQIPDTRFAAQMLSMALMIPLTILVVVYARIRKQELSSQ